MHRTPEQPTPGITHLFEEPPPAAPRRAVLLAGHGSLRSGAGAAMIRLAERAHQAGLAPIVTAGFLNYRRPTFAEALAHCIQDGAQEVVVQPYFLVPGKFVREDLALLLESSRVAHPEVCLRVAQPFGDHPALARLALKRALEADYLAAHPQIVRPGAPRLFDEGASWRPLYQRERTGLLLMAHGSPDAQANRPIYGVARRIRSYGRYAAVTVCFMDLNQPRIPDAVDALVERGITTMIAVPYFLHLGNHVADDLPAIVADARSRHPSCTLLLAEHLGYDRLLASVIAERVAEALAAGAPAMQAAS